VDRLHSNLREHSENADVATVPNSGSIFYPPSVGFELWRKSGLNDRQSAGNRSGFKFQKVDVMSQLGGDPAALIKPGMPGYLLIAV
jgi:hypothetical protein